MTNLASILIGAVAMASLVAALFFLKFWRQTRDTFFLFFACAFLIDAVSRLVFGIFELSDESEPVFYLTRIVMFGLILIAIVQKNRPQQGRRQ
ncbi:MAG: DUF5985 family protein [Bradyrhizobium sp.]